MIILNQILTMKICHLFRLLSKLLRISQKSFLNHYESFKGLLHRFEFF